MGFSVGAAGAGAEATTVAVDTTVDAMAAQWGSERSIEQAELQRRLRSMMDYRRGEEKTEQSGARAFSSDWNCGGRG